MQQRNSAFYFSMLKPQYKGSHTMADERKYADKIATLTDGHYSAVLKRVSRYELKDGRGYFMNFYFNIDGKDYEHGQFVSEKSEPFLYSNFLIPLGCYASQKGIDEALALKDLYVELDKETDGQYARVKLMPLFECKKNAPVGAKNTCIESQPVVEETSEFDDIPY